MRATAALAKLVAELDTAAGHKMVPTAEAVAEWRALAHQVQAEAVDEWQEEPLFRLRTGAAAKWCRGHFSRYERLSLARRDARGRRVWHIAVRPVRRVEDADPAAVKRAIVDSFQRKAS